MHINKLKRLAQEGDPFALDVLINQLQSQQRAVTSRYRAVVGEPRVLPAASRDAFFSCSKAF
jgi:hypothetical protein